MDNDKIIARSKIENKISIKLIVSALFILLLTILLTIKPGVNNVISRAYYLISIGGLLLLFFKYQYSLGLYISDKKINSCYNIADLLSIFVVACAVFQFIFIFWFFPARVKGPSMEPTFYTGDLIICSNTDVDNQDVVVIEVSKNVLYIKRVIAKGGDTFYYHEGKLYVNGVLHEETYLGCPPKEIKIDDFKHYEGIEYDLERKCYVVSEGYYFVLGDNRLHSNDSEEIGLFTEEQILGKVEYKMNNLFSWEKLEW